MRAYVICSGLVFALVLVAHAARLVAEGAWLAAEPSFLLTSALAAGLAAWAAVLVRRSAPGR